VGRAGGVAGSPDLAVGLVAVPVTALLAVLVGLGVRVAALVGLAALVAVLVGTVRRGGPANLVGSAAVTRRSRHSCWGWY
jgi:hypothetical protein